MAGFNVPVTPPTTQVTDLGGAANQVLYLNSDGAVTELPLGASGEVLTSAGPSSAPAFQPAGGASVALILALGG